MRREPVIITDAVYTRCAIQHDKSLTVNCLILFMTYWHKVQMSCRQTQPVVLRRGVRFRHGSLFHQRVNSSSAARALCGIGIVAYLAKFLVNIFHLPLSRSYLASLEKPRQYKPDQPGVCDPEPEDTCTNADGDKEWKWFQSGDLVFGFPTRSIAHHKINTLNAE